MGGLYTLKFGPPRDHEGKERPLEVSRSGFLLYPYTRRLHVIAALPPSWSAWSKEQFEVGQTHGLVKLGHELGSVDDLVGKQLVVCDDASAEQMVAYGPLRVYGRTGPVLQYARGMPLR